MSKFTLADMTYEGDHQTNPLTLPDGICSAFIAGLIAADVAAKGKGEPRAALLAVARLILCNGRSGLSYKMSFLADLPTDLQKQMRDEIKAEKASPARTAVRTVKGDKKTEKGIEIPD